MKSDKIQTPTRPRRRYVPFPERLKRSYDRKINCIVFLRQTLNNLFFTAKDRRRRVLLVRSSGAVGFSGPKRTTHFASTALARNVARGLRLLGKRYVRLVLLSKVNKHTKLAIKNLSYGGLRVLEIIERVRTPHNGLRGPKIRRL